MSNRSLTRCSPSPPRVETPGEERTYRKGRRPLSIDFEALEALLYDEESSNITEDLDYLRDVLGNTRARPTPIPSWKSQNSKLFLHSSFTNSIFHATNFRDLRRSGQKLSEVFGQNPEDAWWLDMQNPSSGEVRKLCSAFDVHPLTIEDILTRETSEKIEEYPSYRFASIQSFHEVIEDGETIYEPYSIYLIVFLEGTLSFYFSHSVHSVHVEERITKFEDHVSIQSNWVFYAFCDDIVDSFHPIVASIEKEVNQIDDQVYTTRKDDMKNFLWEIEAIRRRVLSLIRLLGGKTNLLKAFENHHYATTSSDSEIKIYINDVQDHVVAMLGSLHQFEGLLSRSKSSYLAQIEVSSMTERFKVFRALARMAVLSLILTLLTLCANMFGMNTSADYVIFNEGTNLPWFMIALGELMLFLALFYGAKLWGIWW